MTVCFVEDRPAATGRSRTVEQKVAERAATKIACHDAPSHVTSRVIIEARLDAVVSRPRSACHFIAAKIMGETMGGREMARHELLSKMTDRRLR